MRSVLSKSPLEKKDRVMKKIVLSIFIIAALSSCGEEKKPREEKVFNIDVNIEDDFINIDNTKKQGNSHSGNFYSAVDKGTIYGAGFSKIIDDSLKSYNLDLIIDVWVRENIAPCEGSIAISLNKKDGTPKEWAILKPENFKEKQWIHVIDTFRYKSDIMNEVNEIKIFSMKDAGDDTFDIDDLKIKYIFNK